MKRLLLLALAGCGVDLFIGPLDGAPPADGALDGATEAGDAMEGGTPSDAAPDEAATDAPSSDAPETCNQAGGVACTDALTAYCTAWEKCCQQQPGMSYCAAWGSSVSTCKMAWSNSGFDCTTGKYTSKAVCASLTKQCSMSSASAACSAIFQSQGPNAGSLSGCPQFWSQF